MAASESSFVGYSPDIGSSGASCRDVVESSYRSSSGVFVEDFGFHVVPRRVHLLGVLVRSKFCSGVVVKSVVGVDILYRSGVLVVGVVVGEPVPRCGGAEVSGLCGDLDLFRSSGMFFSRCSHVDVVADDDVACEGREAVADAVDE